MFGATQRNRRRISSDWAGGAGRAVAPSVPARYWISRPVGVHRLGEELRQPLGHLLLPEVHLRGMPLVLRRNGVHRVDVLERFQPDLGLQRGTMLASFVGQG